MSAARAMRAVDQLADTARALSPDLLPLHVRLRLELIGAIPVPDEMIGPFHGVLVTDVGSGRVPNAGVRR